MCGRFAITLPTDAMAQLFAASPANNLPDVPNYNVCPTNDVHVVLGHGDAARRRLVAMRWGFIPKWYKKPNDGPLLINARAETLAEKPAFSEACRERRCLIPVSGFYEWTKDDEGLRWPWYIHAKAPLAMAGVWQEWSQGDLQFSTCAMVTTGANKTMSRIHHRMPVIVSQENWALWLGEAGHGAAKLMTAAHEDLLTFHQVDRAVNSNRAAGAELIAPL